MAIHASIAPAGHHPLPVLRQDTVTMRLQGLKVALMKRDIDPRMPRFRTIGPRHAARVILQCSSCEMDIRELKPKEVIDVTRAYYCAHCDTGTIIENPAH